MNYLGSSTFSKVYKYCLFCSAAEAVVEHIAATPGRPLLSSSSVTSQPTPRTDLFPTSPNDNSSSGPAGCPPASPSETEQPKPPPAEDEEETQDSSQPKHRTLLDIDRFTLCGNRIGWTTAANDVAMNHSGKVDSKTVTQLGSCDQQQQAEDLFNSLLI